MCWSSLCQTACDRYLLPVYDHSFRNSCAQRSSDVIRIQVEGTQQNPWRGSYYRRAFSGSLNRCSPGFCLNPILWLNVHSVPVGTSSGLTNFRLAPRSVSLGISWVSLCTPTCRSGLSRCSLHNFQLQPLRIDPATYTVLWEDAGNIRRRPRGAGRASSGDMLV